MDMRHLAGSVAAQPGSESAVEQAELLSAVNKTVSVLEHTRRHFKSKELGELRRELEALLRQKGVESAVSPETLPGSPPRSSAPQPGSPGRASL